MISYCVGNTRFNYRVAGVAIEQGRVLLHRGEKDDFWALPGGRAELLEPAAQTLRREMREELGLDVEVGRLLWVAENFFDFDGAAYHELGFYFQMQLPGGCELQRVDTCRGTEESAYLIFQWHPLSALENTRLYPSFLRRGLLHLPKATQHVVHTDEPD